MTRFLPAVGLVWVLVAGCDNDSNLGDRTLDGGPATPSDTNLDDVQLRIDVLPAAVREDASLGGDFRVLPQTFLPTGLTADDLRVGTFELQSPKELTGSVTGYRMSPQIAQLPGTEEPVDATVWMRAPGTTQSAFTVTDAQGDFALWIVPQTPYRLEIVPTDPLFPVWASDLTVGASVGRQDVALGTGVPIYGIVQSESGPVVGARIHVVDPVGLTSAVALTSTYGLYQIRVMPGTWTVVCEGRDLGNDATITIPNVVVGDTGSNVDVTYPTVLGTVLVEGHLETETGTTTAGTTVRFTAESLVGYDTVGNDDGFAGATATWVGETPVSDNGTILTRVVPGTYTVEILPPNVDSGPEFSPRRITGVSFDRDENVMGEITLDPLVAVTGTVHTAAGGPVADAVVTCVEDGFDGRFWTTVADGSGSFATSLPEIPLTCEVTPPSGRGLASERFPEDPSVDATFDFEVPEGRLVSGTVSFDAVPESFAVVNVYDLDGVLLGFGITDVDGAFAIPVDLEGARIAE